MVNEVSIASSGAVTQVRVTGKLTKEAYEEFVPVLDAQIQEHGRIRILFEMHDFHGWTAGALWEDLRFDVQHWRDIERLAIVGESKWEKGMAVFCKPFTSASIRYFDQAQRDEAQEWLTED